jgi:hypothetical protein
MARPGPRSAVAWATSWPGSRPASLAARRVRHSPLGLVAGFGAVSGSQDGREQVPVALLAGGDGFGDP